MELSEQVAKVHEALVECLAAVTDHSSRVVLEMGGRIGDVMAQGLTLRSLMQEVAATVGTSHTATMVLRLKDCASELRTLAREPEAAGKLATALATLADTLEQEMSRLSVGDRRRQAEVLTLTGELTALTSTLVAQTGEAITALQFQDPAIQDLRRIDSLILDLRRSIDDGATAVRWSHRLGDARTDQPRTPAEIASRAQSIRLDVQRRVDAFRDQSQHAVREVQRIHTNLRSVTHAQVQKSEQTVKMLDPVSSSQLEQYCLTFGDELSKLEAMFDTGHQVTGHLNRILELKQGSIEDGAGGRSSIAEASDQLSALTDDLVPQADLEVQQTVEQIRMELRRTQAALEQLLAHDARIRALAEKVDLQLEATRDAFAAFDPPAGSASPVSPIPGLLDTATRTADRLFEVVVDSFGLDASTVEPEVDWQATLEDESTVDSNEFILL